MSFIRARLDCQNFFGKPFSKICRFAVNSYQRIIPETRCVLYRSKEEMLLLKFTLAQISSISLTNLSEVRKWFFVSLLPGLLENERRGGLMVGVLFPGSSGLGSSPSRGHYVVFLGKTLYSHSASLHPGV